MTLRSVPDRDGSAGETVVCRRLKVPRAVGAHRDCSYCFGSAEAILSGDYERFCSFEAGVDPLCFGFPDTFGRYRMP